MVTKTKTDKEAREKIADYIGEGVHTGLRKWCESEESHKAWIAIRDMPGEEWGNIANELAKLILDCLPELGYRKLPEEAITDMEKLAERFNEWVKGRIADCDIPPLSVNHARRLAERLDTFRWVKLNFKRIVKEIQGE